MRVRAVSAYVPLLGRTRTQFKELGSRLVDACHGNITMFWDFPFEDCWLAQENPPWKAANARAADRFQTDDEHIRSNIIQHSPTQWARLAALDRPDVDVWVWLGASILKQGAWRNNQITEAHIAEFMRKVAQHGPFVDIPFPGIEPPKPVQDHGDNWRFVGSTHIWPIRFLSKVDQSYRHACRLFIQRVGAVPIDLAIWPTVEQTSGLPFTFYQGEYDATQLTNFPA